MILGRRVFDPHLSLSNRLIIFLIEVINKFNNELVISIAYNKDLSLVSDKHYMYG